jgi:UDP-N-acetyl-D-glucosamine/UDP-N-acetyl-D-galactosamine dehydrogenase
MLGYHPKVILAGRRINDGMSAYVAQQTIKQMIGNGTNIKGAKVIVLGLTFKENCSDLRNSKVADVVKELQEFGCEMHVHDPLAEPEQALHEYGITLSEWGQLPQNADAIVAAVPHAEYTTQPVANLLALLKPGGVFIDIKSAYSPEAITAAGACLWRL